MYGKVCGCGYDCPNKICVCPCTDACLCPCRNDPPVEEPGVEHLKSSCTHGDLVVAINELRDHVALLNDALWQEIMRKHSASEEYRFEDEEDIEEDRDQQRKDAALDYLVDIVTSDLDITFKMGAAHGILDHLSGKC